MKTLILLTALALSLCGNVFGQESKTPKTLNLGVLNEKAKVLQMPNYQSIQPRIAGNVTVLIKIELQTGKVIEAKTISGHSLLRKSAEEAALKAEFAPILKEFDTIYGTGTLAFKLENSTGKVVENKNPKTILPLIDFRNSIVNGKASNLVTPKYTEEARNACAAGVVEVLTFFHSGSGKIFAAKAISGNEILFDAAEKAVLNSTLSPSNITGDNDVYMLSKIVYNFDSFSKCLTVGIVNDRTLSLPKPKVEHIIQPKHLQLTKEEIVAVQIVVDISGKVTHAKALTGHILLRPPCESAARQAKFSPTNYTGLPVRVKALLIYKIKPDGTVDIDVKRSDKTVVGTPINLIEPPMPFCNCRFGKNPNIAVEAKINEQGKVTEAKSWAGHPILKNLCEKAALESKFLPTDIEAKITIVYNFESLDEENQNVKLKNIEIKKVEF